MNTHYRDYVFSLNFHFVICNKDKCQINEFNMPIRKISIGFLYTVAITLMVGCTTKSWYDGIKQGNINDCNKQPSGAQQDCLNRVSHQTYDSYEKERAAKKP